MNGRSSVPGCRPHKHLQHLCHGWGSIRRILPRQERGTHSGISALSGSIISSPIDRSSSDWSPCCNMAFRCLKLIVDDFLDVFPEIDVSSEVSSRRALLDCCTAFGSSRHDVNMSLTATGMLWTIADQNPSPLAVDVSFSKAN